MRSVKLCTTRCCVIFVTLAQWLAMALLFLRYQYKQSGSINCTDSIPRSHYGQRGNYGVLYNYILPTKWFHCHESITYTTHGEWTYLDNLIPLLERWQGPVSLTLYTPGDDFYESLRQIQFYRECLASPLVKELVTFHLFFDLAHVPPQGIHQYGDINSTPVNCSELNDSISFSGSTGETFRKAENLIYPINEARNIAREMATTHFVFPCDIELYPSPNFIPQFLDMIYRNDTIHTQTPKPRVFVLPVFEVDAKVAELPNVKQDLVYLLRNKSSVPFHTYVCPHCHRIPKMDEWINATIEPGLHVFHVGKRYKPQQSWEPFYIGTKADPMFDERLTWEGRRDKMAQAYILCVMDCEFLVLDNAFLVHRPGIKKGEKVNKLMVKNQNELIAKTVLPEYNLIYGKRSGCIIS